MQLVLVVDVVFPFIRRKCRLQTIKGDCLGTDSWHGDLVRVSLARNDAVRASVGRGKARLDASPAYKYVCRRLEGRRNVDVGCTMRRCVDWLEPGYFEAKLVQRRCALLTLLCLFEWGAAEHGSGDC